MKTKQQVLKSYIVNAVAVVLLYLILLGAIQTGSITRYLQGIVMTIFINIILATSLNLTTGFLGQIAIGHAGFMSIGAYTAALFVKYIQSTGVVMLADGDPTPQGQVFFLVSLVVGGLLATVFGLLVGIPALRLKGDYLAIITLGFGEIIRSVIENVSFTGGAQGLKKIPKLATLEVVYIVTILCVMVMYTFVRSRHGRAITAIREDDIASEASGIHNTYYRVLAFTVAAFFAGIAGGIYAQYLTVLGASTFNFNKSIDILVMVVLGGMGSLTGSIVAAVALTALPEILRFIPNFSDYRMLIYSIVLIIVMIFKPSGLLGRYEFSLTRLLEKGAALLKGKKPSASEEGGAGK
jgi:branched-chain amino acid transport system permease protein